MLSYNQEAYIENALVSLLQQNLEGLEIVISDDASSDMTVKIIRKVLDASKTEKKSNSTSTLKTSELWQT